MYAVIEQGGKQYKVADGDTLYIELTEVAPDAETIELDKVLFVSDGKKVKIGTPYLEGAKVIASFKIAIFCGALLRPVACSNAGRTYWRQHTKADTGLPGSAKTTCLFGPVPNHIGLPGRWLIL